MSAIDEQLILHEEALDDLYTWIDGIPFSRPKKNIARDFSDGVLCAELIAFFQPKMVDMHNYFPASSVMQKKINWGALNRKVFCKMAMRLTDNTIQQLIEAKPGAIEQILWDIRRKLGTVNNSAQQQTPQIGRLECRNRPGTAPGNRTDTTGFGSGSRYNQTEMGKTLSYRNSLHNQEFVEETPITVIGGAGKLSSVSPNRTTLKPPAAIVPPSGYQSSYQNSYVTQECIAPPAKSSPSNMSAEATNNNSASPPPAQIIYRGHKMISLGLLEEREREIKSLELTNKTLLTKVNRVETLINVKDQRIEDLTHQLHNIRTMYERVTQQTWTGY